MPPVPSTRVTKTRAGQDPLGRDFRNLRTRTLFHGWKRPEGDPVGEEGRSTRFDETRAPERTPEFCPSVAGTPRSSGRFPTDETGVRGVHRGWGSRV